VHKVSRFVLLSWPLAGIASAIPEKEREARLADLRILTCPAFGCLDDHGMSRVVYHLKVLDCFDEISERLDIYRTRCERRKMFRSHAFLTVVFDRIFGTPLGYERVQRLDNRAKALLCAFSESEQLAVSDQLYRQLLVAVATEFIFGFEDLTESLDPHAKLSFLRYALATLPQQAGHFPERAEHLELVKSLSDAAEASETIGFEQRLIVQRLDAFLESDTSGQEKQSRVFRSAFTVKPAVETAVQRIRKWLGSYQRPDLQGFAAAAGTIRSNPSNAATFAGRTTLNVEAGRHEDSGKLPPYIGSYIIRKRLGGGSMGNVYLATSPEGGQVALKVMKPEVAARVMDIVRFGREIEICLKLEHPSIVRTFDYGTAEGQTYLVMECLAGGSLADRLGDDATLGERSTWNLVRQIAEALDYTWNLPKSYMHRDIKSGNILLDGQGHAKLADFGLAAGVSDDATRFTKPGEALGTPLYMAPELVDDASAVDIRVDLWSLGVLAYRCLTGVYPFMANSLPALLAQIQDEPPREAAARLKFLSPCSREILLKLLTKLADDRFQTPRELVQRIERMKIPVHEGFPAQALTQPLSLHHGRKVVFIAVGETLRFGRNAGPPIDFCLRPLPGRRYAEETTLLSGEHGRFEYRKQRIGLYDSSSNGIFHQSKPVGEGVAWEPKWGDRIALAEALELDLWPSWGGMLITRPQNWSEHAYLWVHQEFDLREFPEIEGWPTLSGDIVRRKDRLFFIAPEDMRANGESVRKGSAIGLRPGIALEGSWGRIEARATELDMFKRPEKFPAAAS